MPTRADGSSPQYGGSARYYLQGRLPYPRALVEQFLRFVPARGRLLDVGCGPGRLALLLADHFTDVVGIDADPDMIEHARATSYAPGRGLSSANAQFLVMPAEELPAGLGRFGVVTFALSFHWLDQEQVAAATFDLLEPRGAALLVHAFSLRGDPVQDGNPVPPYRAVAELLDGYLGSDRHIGRAVPGEEAGVMRAAGLEGPVVVVVPGGEVVTSTVEDLLARLYSTSAASPQRFGNRRVEAERDVRRLLAAASPTGHFDERLRDARLDIWRRP